MSKWFRFSLATAVVASVALSGAHAAKNAPKKVKSTSLPHYVKGTSQLAGAEAKFGETWTLGKTNPWNVTLNSAEYSVDHLVIGDRTYTPGANEKMLVLRYTIHNPQSREALMRFDTFKITAVDSNNTNWESIGSIGSETSKERVQVRMKPAQKMDVYTAIMVPSVGPIPKVIFKAGDQTVLRYYPDDSTKPDQMKVKPLTAPFADSADASGRTAASNVTAAKDTYYPLEFFDLKLDSCQFTDETLLNKAPGKNNRFLVAKFTTRNAISRPNLLRYDTFAWKLVDQDGINLAYGRNLMAATRNVALEGVRPEPGAEVVFRIFFTVPNDANPQKLTVFQGKSRSYTFDVTDVK
ncbi:MAG: hypothetical protein ACYC64_11510 [Armatimonadota bacterium]